VPSPLQSSLQNLLNLLQIVPPKVLVYCIGVVLLLILIPVLGWLIFKPLPPTVDLGEGIFNAAGLRGHLVANWEGKAGYRFRLEPIGMQYQAGFAAVLANPQRPFSAKLHLMDANGFTICSTEILFPFDPAQAPDPNPLTPPPAPKRLSRAEAELMAAQWAAQQQERLHQRQLQELDREHGQEIFQNELGSDGTIAAVTAQSDLPCDRSAYKRFDTFNFTTNFPSYAEQTDLLRQQATAIMRPVPKATPIYKPSVRTSPFVASVEGDDVITGYAPARGVATTSGGKIFLLEKGNLHGNAAGWQVFPASIHYRCDSRAACLLTRSGTSVVLYARLKR
jgi:hypothetical protein